MNRLLCTAEGRLALRALLLALLSLAGAEVGHWLSFQEPRIATFWPPSGILLAALALSKPRDWWAFLFGQVAANLASDTLLHQQPVIVSAGFCFANCSEALAGAAMLRHLHGGEFAFRKLRDVLDYLVSGTMVGSTTGALLGGTILTVAFPGQSYLVAAATWWISSSLAVLVVGSLGISLCTDRSSLRSSDLLSLTALLVLLGAGISWASQPAVGLAYAALAYPLVYLQLPAFTAIIFNRKLSLMVVLVIAVVALFRTTRDLGIIPQLCSAILDRAICLHIFLGITSVSALFAGAIVEERRAAQEENRIYLALLEERVAKRTRQLDEATAQLMEKRNLLAHACRISTAGELAAGIAHELNQPLYAIHNYASGLKRYLQTGLDDVDLPAVLDDLRLESQRAAGIVKRLRQFVQRTAAKPEDVSLAEVLRDALQLNRHELNQKEIRTRLDLPDTLPTIRGDAIQIQQVLVNLLRNAMESLVLVPVPQREIRITIIERGGVLHTTVADSGAGLAPEIQGRLFEAFFTTKPDGMGIGLPLSRSIVEAHGGTLTARPCEPTGAAFEFTLPVAAANDAARTADAAEPLARPHFSLAWQIEHDQVTRLPGG